MLTDELPVIVGSMTTTGNLTDPREIAPDGRSVWWTIASGLALLAFRPYQGIVHDARLYFGYALSALHPDTIGQDVLFQQDGQSGWSVYPVLLRWLVEGLGPGRAAQLAALAGLAVWLVGFARLVGAVTGTRTTSTRNALLVLGTIALPLFYGPFNMFQLAEPYATPRALAEGLSLLALADALERRWIGFAAWLSIALLAHPLMALPVAAIATLNVVANPEGRDDSAAGTKRLLFVVFGAVVAGSLIGAALPRFDAQWRAVLDDKRALVFPSYWRLDDYSRVVIHFITLAIGAPLLSKRGARIATLAAVIALVGILVTWLLGDVIGTVIVAQSQPWRALWLVTLMAGMSLVRLVSTAFQSDFEFVDSGQRALRIAAVALLFASWIVQEVNGRAAVLALLAALCWWSPRYLSLRLPRRGEFVLVGLSATLVLASVGVVTWVAVQVARATSDNAIRWSGFYSSGIGFPALAVLAFVAVRSSERFALPRWVVAVAVLMLGGVAWLNSDLRSRYQRYLESTMGENVRGASAQVRADGPVAWFYGEMESWAFAAAPGWGSIPQGIPLVFDRRLAITWRERSKHLQAVGLVPRAQAGGALVAPEELHIRAQALTELCRATDHPAVVVLPSAMLSSELLAKSIRITLAVGKPLRPAQLGAGWMNLAEFAVYSCDSTTPRPKSESASE